MNTLHSAVMPADHYSCSLVAVAAAAAVAQTLAFVPFSADPSTI